MLAALFLSDHQVSMLFVLAFTLHPLQWSVLPSRVFSFDFDLCGSDFNLFFVRTSENLWARVLVGVPESGVLCFVTEFAQRYECLCHLILERSYNFVSVHVTIDTMCWL